MEDSNDSCYFKQMRLPKGVAKKVVERVSGKHCMLGEVASSFRVVLLLVSKEEIT